MITPKQLYLFKPPSSQPEDILKCTYPVLKGNKIIFILEDTGDRIHLELKNIKDSVVLKNRIYFYLKGNKNKPQIIEFEDSFTALNVKRNITNSLLKQNKSLS